MLKNSKVLNKLIAFLIIFSMVLTHVSMENVCDVYAATNLISSGRTVYASSGTGASYTVDGDTSTRWESEWQVDPQWIYVDLGADATISSVKINWEGAYATSYKIQVSDDEYTWEDIYSTDSGSGGIVEHDVSGLGRYVRLYCISRALDPYGYSLYEFEVYGEGGIYEEPTNYGANVALNKAVATSSEQDDWYIVEGQVDAENAVDGDTSTRWGSILGSDPEWIYVDLGSEHTIGRVILKWETAAGKVYDIQVSNDAENWETVYREFRGDGDTDNIQLYATGRYVRMYGYSRATTYGYSLYEFEVYDYIEGDDRPSYTIGELPTASVVEVEGSGSYSINDLTMPTARLVDYITDDIEGPLPSNDWWQHLMCYEFAEYPLVTYPLSSKYESVGLSIQNPGAGWWDDDRTQKISDEYDITLMQNDINTSKLNTKVAGYGDFSVTSILSDDEAEMKTTFVKGSPYVFTEFSDPDSAEIYSSKISRIFDDNNNSILTTDGESITTDHIGIEVINDNGDETVTRYYAVTAPADTEFVKAGAKIKMYLGSNENYVSIAAMPSYSNLNYFYQHGYAFPTDTLVSYDYDETSSLVTTDFNVKTELKRVGFSNETLMCMLPHQYKLSDSSLTNLTYPSVRGTLKVHEGNSFTVVDRFYGIVPQFTEPTNDGYSRDELLTYLELLDEDTSGDIMKSDAYWQGKTIHPLAMGVLIADQLGEETYKDEFLDRMKTILSDWYTYTLGETDYNFYYDQEWGSLYYRDSEFGANTGLTDHHFTYGYYVFASAILATYDEDFYDEYGTMVEYLIRDYANPSKTDPLFPQFRNFDPYEGHSWAGGYADNDGGNNQEALGEALFGWVGQYFWAMLTDNEEYRDAAIYGFTTELKAGELYWFNYDNDTWTQELFPHEGLGQVYGRSNYFGTFFNGDPTYVYGIHWLPTAEYLTSYGFDPSNVQELYEGFISDNGGSATVEDWYHITEPIHALYDPEAVMANWDITGMQQNEVFNTYWFINNMDTLGNRTKDIWAEGDSSSTVYEKDGTYRALIWNPTNETKVVTFRNADGKVGSATVETKGLVQVDPTQDTVYSTVPGKIEAEDYADMYGIGTEACTEGGDNVGYVDSGDWLDYNVNVETAGAYTAEYRVASLSGGGQFDLMSGDTVLATTDVSTTGGWQTWETVSETVYLSDGPQTLRLSVNDGGFNINYMNFTFGIVESTTNLAVGKTVTASSQESDTFASSNATDNNFGTRWASSVTDPQWIAVDLGENYNISSVVLEWESAYASEYQIQVSDDGETWNDVYSTTTGDGGNDTINLSDVSARYVRMYGTQRATEWGYSLWEFQIMGN